MNILYITNNDPRLRGTGSQQRTNNLWNALKSVGKVYTLVEVSSVDNCNKNSEDEAPILYHADIEKTCAFFWRALIFILKKINSFSIFDYKLYKEWKITDYYNCKIDIVVTRYVAPCNRKHFWEIAPTYIDIDDSPIEIYQSTRRSHIPRLLRFISDWCIKTQMKYVLKHIKGGWVANELQVHYLNRLFTFLPNIPDTPSDNYQVNEKERLYLFTVGSMSYSPNYKGVDWFLSEIWPSFHNRYPNVKYLICGGGAPQDYVKKWHSRDGVEYKGFVEDIESIYQHAYAAVVPVLSGAGTCIKTLEAMSFSRICLTTKFGARGLDEEVKSSYRGINVFDSSDSFISSFNYVVTSASARSVAENSVRAFVESNYSIGRFECAVKKELRKNTDE